MTDAQALLRGAFQKCLAHDHLQRAPARQVAYSFGQRDHFLEPRPAFVTSKQMFLDGLFFGFRQRGEPVIGEDGGVQRIRAPHAVTPMQSRNW